MKGFTLIICLCFSLLFSLSKIKNRETLNPKIQSDICRFDGKKLYGKIRLVEYASQADIKVKIVNSFPDLKVKFVENFANDCGEWQIVEHGEDLRVFISENFADLKIKPVNSFPGMVR
ncbi:hypothetical protein [Tenacibaculum jejuense]|uniref:7(1) septoil knot domain-containing protein n=1 Tax=Tenacibaculum jejuense TaxID=584609 RepID=A0A238U5D9_9FLAO|nr:hypothetical protein [Tenacibaculum jejuense]SNR13828.1 Protein of unknown function [Tenacibaculum jejuense]